MSSGNTPWIRSSSTMADQTAHSERDEVKIREYFKKRPKRCNNPCDFLLTLPSYLACQEQTLTVIARLFEPGLEPSSDEPLVVNRRNECVVCCQAIIMPRLTHVGSRNGDTQLLCAAFKNQRGKIKALLAQQAGKPQPPHADITITSRCADPNMADRDGWYPLHLTADVAVAKALVKVGTSGCPCCHAWPAYLRVSLHACMHTGRSPAGRARPQRQHSVARGSHDRPAPAGQVPATGGGSCLLAEQVKVNTQGRGRTCLDLHALERTIRQLQSAKTMI